MLQKPLKTVAVKAHGKAKPMLEYSEHACAFGYAMSEFMHFHGFLLLSSGFLLFSVTILLIGKVLVRMVVIDNGGDN